MHRKDCRYYEHRIGVCTRTDVAQNECSDGREDADAIQGNRWRDVFDRLTYTNGPGDNVYVYG